MRLALGAGRLDIMGPVLRETVTWLVIGIGVGAGVSLMTGRVIASQLFGVSASSIASLILASTALGVIALAASLMPLGRALRIQPTTALKSE